MTWSISRLWQSTWRRIAPGLGSFAEGAPERGAGRAGADSNLATKGGFRFRTSWRGLEMGDKGAGDEGADEVVRTAGGLLACGVARNARSDCGGARDRGSDRPGRHALYKSTQNYIVHLREVAAGRHIKDGTVDAVKASVHAKLQRARLDQLRGDMLEEKLTASPRLMQRGPRSC